MRGVRTDLVEEQLGPRAIDPTLDVAVQHPNRLAVALGEPEQHGRVSEERGGPLRIRRFANRLEVDLVLEPCGGGVVGRERVGVLCVQPANRERHDGPLRAQ